MKIPRGPGSEGGGDVVLELPGEGIDLMNSLLSLALGDNLENLVIVGPGNANASGNSLDNSLTGNGENNEINGKSGIDTLTGTGGGDRFILGIVSGRFYDDGLVASPGLGEYALNTDFTPGDGDQLQLKGTAGQYLLGASPVGGVAGTGLFHDSNNYGILNPDSDELIAILQSPVGLKVANTINTAVFV